MKLLIVNDSGIIGGGAEARIRLLVQELLRRKTFKEIHLLGLKCIRPKESNLPIKIHSCDSKDSYKKTKEIIKNFGIDLVQAHNLLAISTGPIKAAKELKKPIIWFAHDYWAFCGRRILLNKENKPCKGASILKCSNCIGLLSFLRLKIMQQMLNKCDIAIAPSKFVRDIYEHNGILNNRWEIVYPWIDIRLFLLNKQKKGKNTILFVGPLAEHKGTALFVSALSYIKEKVPNIDVRIVGSQQERDNLLFIKIKNSAKNNNTLQNISFLGYKEAKELAQEYSKAKVYVCPPLWPEVFGQTWAQALACGCEVVATKQGSIPELAQNAAYFCENNAQDLADTVIKALNSKKSKNDFFDKNRLSVKAAATSLIKTYEKTLHFDR